MVIPLLLTMNAVASVPAQAVVRIERPAVARSSDWSPSGNPRQHERIVIDRGQRTIVRVTDFE